MAEETNAALQDKAALIYRRLMDYYGKPTWRAHYEPLDELVLTILSQNTTDVNSEKAFRHLRDLFPTWEEVMQAPLPALKEAVRIAGLSNQKAPRIQAALRRIYEQEGQFDLSFLSTMPVEEAETWLTAIHGVGHKTASIVLLFCFNKPTFPVDTHVLRVSKRLGIVPDNANAYKTRKQWEVLVPAGWYYPLHLNIIRHGRETCKARKPLCHRCPLLSLCPFGQAVIAKDSMSLP